MQNVTNEELTPLTPLTLFGEDIFVDSFTDYLGRHKNVPEIPKSQRYATRPALEKIFKGSILSDRAKRDRMIRKAVEKFGYTQRSAGRGRLSWDALYVYKSYYGEEVNADEC
jgi:hypothetical protein